MFYLSPKAVKNTKLGTINWVEQEARIKETTQAKQFNWKGKRIGHVAGKERLLIKCHTKKRCIK